MSGQKAPNPNKTAAEFLRDLPSGRRESLVRGATREIIMLLDSVHNAVGFPKEEGWSPVLAHDLERVRQQLTDPKKLPEEP